MKTEDASVTSGKTYYTKSSGMYTKATSPAAGSPSNYYEFVGAAAPTNSRRCATCFAERGRCAA